MELPQFGQLRDLSGGFAMRTLMLFACAVIPASAVLAQNVTGTWQGSLQGPQGPALRLVMKVSLDNDKLKAVSYSIDQNPTPIPASSITRDGSSLKITLAAIGGSWEGKISADGNSLTGTWTQGGGNSSLNFTRATPETTWTIPEPPPPPKIMAADVNPEFEVATIKPSKPGAPGKGIRVGPNGVLTTLNYSVSDLIQFAYKLHAKQIEGGKSSLEELYDITGKPDHEGIGNDRQIRLMVQKLLKDRFQLATHTEKKELSVYAITILKTGAKLPKTANTSGVSLPGLGIGRGALNVRNGTIADFASLLQSNILERPVVDQTGLTDRFDFSLKYTPDASQLANLPPGLQPPADDPDAPPDLFTAVQQQLGLKIESAKAPVDVMVIDKIEKPSDN
jgi:uncharacterized protein (TIGR03435 family)